MTDIAIGRKSAPRRGLPMYSPELPRVIFSERSGNRKLGGIPAAIVSAETCPPSCGFYGKGCYAENHFTAQHWRRAAADGLQWEQFVNRVRALPKGQLWRYAVAGDLPGQGDSLDLHAVGELATANKGRRGFTFTHKPLKTQAELDAVRAANASGFTVNLSSDSLAQADARAALGVGPVVVVLPKGASGDIRTPAGRRVVVCPSESRGLTCAQCQLCSHSGRTGIVGFVAHGQMSATVSRIAQGGT